MKWLELLLYVASHVGECPAGHADPTQHHLSSRQLGIDCGEQGTLGIHDPSPLGQHLVDLLLGGRSPVVQIDDHPNSISALAQDPIRLPKVCQVTMERVTEPVVQLTFVSDRPSQIEAVATNLAPELLLREVERSQRCLFDDPEAGAKLGVPLPGRDPKQQAGRAPETQSNDPSPYAEAA